MTGEDILERFRVWYGPQKGLQVYMTVMPGIMRDFTKMLDQRPGEQLREEYRLEDGKGTLILNGSKTAGKDPRIAFSCRDGI